jgi:CheY-like chemotaxis protein
MKKSEVAAPAQAFRVLLIDDNRNGLVVRKSILEEHGFDVTGFTSPEEAMKAFQGSAFDVVITDYRMPKLNGTDVIRIVRENSPATPVLVISGLVDALGLNESNTGADAVIPKSSTEVSHLVRALNRVLRPAPKKPIRSQATKRGTTKAVR